MDQLSTYLAQLHLDTWNLIKISRSLWPRFTHLENVGLFWRYSAVRLEIRDGVFKFPFVQFLKTNAIILP